MKKLTQLTTFIVVAALLAVPAFSDTLVLKGGERLSGLYEGGSAKVIKFRLSDGTVKDYELTSIQQIQFGDEKIAGAGGQSNSSTSPSTAPKLIPGSDRVTKPTLSGSSSPFTVPTGSKIVIRMIDSIDSERNKVGENFVAVLDEAILQGGVEVIPRGSDIRGRIANINEAGRVAGAAELGLELNEIIVNGIPYSIVTSEYNEVAEGRGAQTAKRAAGGAALGALIGAIAGGRKGAAIGAGVGGGGATAVQVLTKGDKLNIPSETKLEFTLRAPLAVAGR